MERMALAEARKALSRIVKERRRVLITVRGFDAAAIVPLADVREIRDAEKAVVQPTRPVHSTVVRASELPVPDKPTSMEGYVCNFEVRGGRCGKPATYFKGPLARCEEH